MRTSAPIARWRNSQGVLTQSWSDIAGRPPIRALTQEHQALRRPSPNPFALFLAVGYLIPGLASMAVAPILAAVVLILLALGKEQIEERLGSRAGFVTVTIACAAAGSALAWAAPDYLRLWDGITGAVWGTAVAVASWRYDLVAGPSPFSR